MFGVLFYAYYVISNNIQSIPIPASNADLETQRGNRIFVRSQELYQERLPKDYEIIANNDDLRISAVVSMKGKCIAYNQRGERLSVSDDECRHQLAQVGNMIKPRSMSSVVTSHEPDLTTAPKANSAPDPVVTKPDEKSQVSDESSLMTS